MWQRGGSGETTVEMASTALALKRVVSGYLCDLDATDIFPLLYDPNIDIGIYAVHALVDTALNAADTDASIGTYTAAGVVDDIDSVVTAAAMSTAVNVAAGVAAGGAVTPALASTLRNVVPKCGGYPVLSAGKVLAVTTAGAGANTGVVYFEVVYFEIEPDV